MAENLVSRLRGIAANIPLVGTDDEVKTQLSLLLGIAQLGEIQTRGLDLDFQKFIDIFEDGFYTGFAPKQNTAINQYWGQGVKGRPKIRVLQEIKASAEDSWFNQGYYLIELLPNRTNEQDSYLCFGPPTQLIQQIMYWMNWHLNQSKINGVGGTSQRLPTSVKGYCLVTLLFVGRTATKKIHRVEKGFRWVRVDPRTVLPEEITKFANLIKTKFDSRFTFSTGQTTFTYNNPDQGFNRVWGYFSQAIDAKKVFEQLLDLQSFAPDWSRLTESKVVSPGNRFQSPAKRIKQGNATVRAAEERPSAIMRFDSAYLKFPHIKDIGVLVDSQGGIMDAVKFLAQYQD